MGVSRRHSPRICRQEARPVSCEQRPETRMELRTQFSPSSKGPGSRSRGPGLPTRAGGHKAKVGLAWGSRRQWGPGGPEDRCPCLVSPPRGARPRGRWDCQPRGTEHAFNRCVGEEA